MIKDVHIIEKRNLWLLASILIIAIGIGVMSMKALKHEPYLNFGIDFTGGSSFMLKFDRLNTLLINAPDKTQARIQFIEETRALLQEFGLDKSQIQITQDQEVIIQTSELQNETRVQLLERMQQTLGIYELLEVDIIGPTIGAELKEQSIWIILVVSLGLLLYITWRFEWVFGLAALSAVLHDGLIVISLATFLNIEINTAFVAAILTILGYSINDTIVIFDRIRENMEHPLNDETLMGLMNRSIKEMMTRSLHTSVTTLMVIGSVLLFGGTTLKEFALVLFIGIIAGTYSSIFIASPVLFLLFKGKKGELN